jgi:4-hydroxythreonine-4-phosphate dehydrogenase
MIGISIGDPTGIGAEVTLKALASEAELDRRYLLLGDLTLLRRLASKLKLALPLVPPSGATASDRIVVSNPLAEPLPNVMPPGCAPAAKAALAWLTEGARRCLAGELKALVTAPLSKEAIILSGTPFVGQTEYLSEMAGTDRTAMMLLGHDERDRWLRVTLATTHVPIKDLPSTLTREKIELAIELATNACRDLRLKRPRVAVCGLNPHAGEGGQMGTEEITTIAPAVEVMKRRGLDVQGPFAADALFYQVFHGEYDAVVAMYHDQGLVPLKMIGFETGVNWTLGLPFIRTSPDHGTAYNIAGKGVANPSSMISAIRLAKQLAASRATSSSAGHHLRREKGEAR